MTEIIEAWAVYRGYFRIITNTSYELPYPWEKGAFGESFHEIYSTNEIIELCNQEMRAL